MTKRQHLEFLGNGYLLSDEQFPSTNMVNPSDANLEYAAKSKFLIEPKVDSKDTEWVMVKVKIWYICFCMPIGGICR